MRRESALTLLVLGVLADNHHLAVAFDYLALFTDGFDGRSDLHDNYLLRLICALIWSAM
jgi:hypothetical protein